MATLNMKEGEVEEEAVILTMLLSGSASISLVIKAAVELNVFEIIAGAGAGAGLTAEEIAAHFPSRDPAAASLLDRLLSFLSAFSILKCSAAATDCGGRKKQYGLAPVSRLLTSKNEDGFSLASFFVMTNHRAFADPWYYLKDSVLEGEIPFNKANAMSAFEYMAKDQHFGEIFNKSMGSMSNLLTRRIIASYKELESLTELVDVGGGNGTTLGVITSKYPHIKGINFDLPHAVSNAPIIQGVEHVGGDMFLSIPSGAAILLKLVLHNWNDEDCLKIMKNCYKALPSFGKLIIVERILPEIPEANDATREAYYMDMCMFNLNLRSKERTEEEFRSLAIEAGFSKLQIPCCVVNNYVMELFK